MLTRKHFNALVQIVQQHRRVGFGGCPHTNHLAFAIADFCEEQNPRFNRESFLSGCGVNQDAKEFFDESVKCQP